MQVLKLFMEIWGTGNAIASKWCGRPPPRRTVLFACSRRVGGGAESAREQPQSASWCSIASNATVQARATPPCRYAAGHRTIEDIRAKVHNLTEQQRVRRASTWPCCPFQGSCGSPAPLATRPCASRASRPLRFVLPCLQAYLKHLDDLQKRIPREDVARFEAAVRDLCFTMLGALRSARCWVHCVRRAAPCCAGSCSRATAKWPLQAGGWCAASATLPEQVCIAAERRGAGDVERTFCFACGSYRQVPLRHFVALQSGMAWHAQQHALPSVPVGRKRAQCLPPQAWGRSTHWPALCLTPPNPSTLLAGPHNRTCTELAGAARLSRATSTS